MDIESLTSMFEQTSVNHKVSEAFVTEINYICNSVISYYNQYSQVYTDVLDILCHCGHDLAYDVSDTFDQDCQWFGVYGKRYVYNYILSRLKIKNLEEYMAINELIEKIKDIYNIQ